MATSHFYRDSYFRRFRSVYKLTLLLVTFCLWFVVVEVATIATVCASCHRNRSFHLNSSLLFQKILILSNFV